MPRVRFCPEPKDLCGLKFPKKLGFACCCGFVKKEIVEYNIYIIKIVLFVTSFMTTVEQSVLSVTEALWFYLLCFTWIGRGLL